MNVQKVRPELAAALAVLLVGIWLGYFLANRAVRTNAIQQECAHYDSKSGEFIWGVAQ